MSSQANHQAKVSSPATSDSVPVARAPHASVERLLHELANRLDGALRHVGLALSNLKGQPSVAPLATGSAEPIFKHLQVANHALQQMAADLRRWRYHPNGFLESDRSGTIGQGVQRAVELLSPQARALGIRLTVELAAEVAELPWGGIDPLLINAIRNSVEAITAQRQQVAACGSGSDAIEIIASKEEGRLVLRIHDTGAGIDPRLVDSMGRVHFGLSTRPGGLGIGLLICRDIVAQLGGSIALSNRPGRGATLTALIPIDHLSQGGAVL
jgi:signal transduction histidine kinase